MSGFSGEASALRDLVISDLPPAEARDMARTMVNLSAPR
jgi:hypothetical protein